METTLHSTAPARRRGRPAGYNPNPVTPAQAAALDTESRYPHDEYGNRITARENALRRAGSFLSDAHQYLTAMRKAHEAGRQIVRAAASERMPDDKKFESLTTSNEGRAVLVRAMVANARLTLARAGISSSPLDAEMDTLLADCETVKGMSWAASVMRAWARNADRAGTATPLTVTLADAPAPRCAKCRQARANHMGTVAMRLQNLGIAPAASLLRTIETLEVAA